MLISSNSVVCDQCRNSRLCASTFEPKNDENVLDSGAVFAFAIARRRFPCGTNGYSRDRPFSALSKFSPIWPSVASTPCGDRLGRTDSPPLYLYFPLARLESLAREALLCSTGLDDRLEGDEGPLGRVVGSALSQAPEPSCSCCRAMLLYVC